MPFRVTNTITNTNTATSLGRNRQRIASAQEQLTSGKRINRPSDDPSGAGAVMRIRTSQAVVSQFRNSTATIKDRLLVTDGALDSYEQRLDRARTLALQGASDTTEPAQRVVIATELEGVRSQLLAVANMRSNEQYVFGGTRQDAPPFDPTSAAAAASTAFVPQAQLEPDATPTAVGVTAETVFSDASGSIFQTLTDVAAALRGTGDAAADKATIQAGLDRLSNFAELSGIARTKIGVQLNGADAADERLNQTNLAFEASASRVEGADFVETALELTNSQNALEATLQASAQIGRRSLIDFLS